MMNFNILFDYPAWLILLCLLCGLLYSGMLYYRNKKAGFSPWLRRLLAFFRFAVVSLLALLLLAPLLERQSQYVEAPLILFFQDNSSSILLSGDTSFYYDSYLPELQSFMENMSDDHDARLYAFGEEVVPGDSIDFTHRMTNISEVFREVEARYSNRNIGSVIMASDGLYNRGINPLYMAARADYPVFTMALGDTVPRRDLILRRVHHNQISYLGNMFPVEIEVEALEAAGLSSRLTITRDGEELFSQTVQFTSRQHNETVSLLLEADEAGMQQYVASIQAVEDEVSLANNSKDFFVDVIDGRQQVLILSNSPHPDVGAIREALERNDHYEVDVSVYQEFGGQVEGYDLLIMHQLPSPQNPAAGIVEQALEANTSVLYVLGSQTDLSAFSRLGHGMEVQARTSDLNETLPLYNQSFALFSIPEPTRSLLDQLPPLYSPFGNYSLPAGAHVLLYQKIGAVPTEQPLVAFSEIGERRSGLITGEGLWRWRLHSFLRQSDHKAFDELLSRIVSYLALQEDRSLFRVTTENLVYENEVLHFTAELYNPAYELINQPEVHLVITGEDGVEYPYVMGRTSNAYRLDAGTFDPGTYSWEARVQSGSESHTSEGVIHVLSLDLEGLRTIADHRLLYQLAENSGAAMYYPGQWDELQEEIRMREDIRPRMYVQKEFMEIINLKPLFFAALLLLSLEWFIRKRSGGY